MGRIIYNIISGIAPFTVQLLPSNIEPIIQNELGLGKIDDVPPGYYLLKITDSMGCYTEELIELDLIVDYLVKFINPQCEVIIDEVTTTSTTEVTTTTTTCIDEIYVHPSYGSAAIGEDYQLACGTELLPDVTGEIYTYASQGADLALGMIFYQLKENCQLFFPIGQAIGSVSPIKWRNGTKYLLKFENPDGSVSEIIECIP